MNDRKDILGVGFDDMSMESFADRAMLLQGGEAACLVVTPNSEIVYEAVKSEELMRVLNSASLVLPDGIGVILASRVLGKPIGGKVAGIDFACALMEKMALSAVSLYLLGGKPGVAQQAAEKLRQRYPGLNICGAADGYFKDDAAAAALISQSGAKVVFVCLGAPKQELWMAKYGEMTGAGLLVGLGGALDIFSGNSTRAPERWRRLGLEWLYRLLKEPKRFKRMLRLPAFLLMAVGKRISGK